MSKQAIYDYLISEYSGRFEKKATKYAIHNLDADYNANALKTTESIQVMEVIRENIDQLRKDLRITIDENSISYTRLMNHLKYLLLRLDTKEKLQMDISEFTKNKFPFAYEQAIRMCDNLSKVLHKELPESEVGYLALHLERILSSAFQN